MRRLSKEKQNQLILVALGAAVLLGAVYFFLISPKRDQAAKLAADTVKQQAKLQQIDATLKQAKTTGQEAGEVADRLQLEEADVATGDIVAWTYETIRQFKARYNLDIPRADVPVQSDVDFQANFPYKQIKFQLIGTGYYHDIGKFIADLENQFPHMRVSNLALDSAGQTDEKLAFRMDVAALVKPSN